jgi:SOS response regulatory protein OraA/RecX
LTAVEIQRRLQDKGVPALEIEEAVDELLREKYLDDTALAYDFIVLRAERKGHAEQRLVRDLVGRGVSESIACAAWRRAVEVGDVEPKALIRRAMERRLARERQFDSAAQRRVYNALLRAGFTGAEIYAELKRQTHGNVIDESE